MKRLQVIENCANGYFATAGHGELPGCGRRGGGNSFRLLTPGLPLLYSADELRLLSIRSATRIAIGRLKTARLTRCFRPEAGSSSVTGMRDVSTPFLPSPAREPLYCMARTCGGRKQPTCSVDARA